jgi:uracil-DNA glycosylase
MSQLNKKEDGVVFLAWGKPAEQKCTPIKASQHRVLTCSHPSPLAAHKTSTPFIGSKIFSKCNAALIAMGKEPVDWSI